MASSGKGHASSLPSCVARVMDGSLRTRNPVPDINKPFTQEAFEGKTKEEKKNALKS
jgi:hypothetical protein